MNVNGFNKNNKTCLVKMILRNQLLILNQSFMKILQIKHLIIVIHNLNQNHLVNQKNHKNHKMIKNQEDHQNQV